MAQPKRKHSKSRTGKRRSSHKLSAPSLVACPRCHQLMKPHHVCPTCGYYAGKEVVEVKEI
ncbi:MAG: 50S ribosomal protein L32 [Deltaproteobacteria bacterium]|nr:50S ribosomal protein L32 [Deltaproteobacteria bacterium]MCL5878595.1 50S ribosomal protein L32 [Deltaproteobacteria bacterium]